MFQQRWTRLAPLATAAAVGLGLAIWPGLSFRAHAQPQVPAAPAPPPSGPAVPPPAPSETPRDDPEETRVMTFQQCVEQLQKARDEVKRLTAAREQKRAELEDLDAHYREAQAYLTSLLEKKVEVLLHEVDASRDELKAQHGAEVDATAPAVAGSISGFTPNAPGNTAQAQPQLSPEPAQPDYRWKRAVVPGRN